MDLQSSLRTATPYIVTIVRDVLIVGLAFMSGISCCLSVWVMNILQLATPQEKAAQFSKTVTMGETYIQPMSRTCSVLLMSMLALTYNDPTYNGIPDWKAWGTALCVLAPTLPYEIMFIFPINEKIKGMLGEMEQGDRKAGSASGEKLDALFRKWRLLNIGRITPPLVASIIILSVLQSREVNR